MNKLLQKNHRLLFYGLWLLLGIMQAGLTELQDDEAYYWVFSRYPDWGYFDHPPMISIMVKIGYSIFPNELGVRLLPLLLNIFSLVLIEKLIDRKNDMLFYIIALSMAVIQLTGFIAVPDSPLIFFTAFFFYCYKRFLDRRSIPQAILLGIAMALLLYSKYHAVLIIFFVILSNIRLFTTYHLYVAGLIAMALFVPHLWWQYQHDWVSFKYHLFESNVNAYKISFTINYVLGQFLLPGVHCRIYFIIRRIFIQTVKVGLKLCVRKIASIYNDRHLCFLPAQFISGKVEANWTSPVLVPLIVLSHQYLTQKIKWANWLFKLLPITIVLVLFARIIMIVDIIPVKAVKDRYHAWKNWPAIMKENTKGLPIVFSNSYQRASKYWFYTKQMTYSQNLYRGRRNNYNFWPIEDSMLGKQVYLLDKYDMWRFSDSLKTPIGWIGYGYDPSFASFAKIQARPVEVDLDTSSTQPLIFDVIADIPDHYRAYLLSHPNLKTSILIAVFDKKGWIKDFPTPLTVYDLLKEKCTINIVPDLKKGKYYLRLAVSVSGYYPTHNSEKIPFEVQGSK